MEDRGYILVVDDDASLRALLSDVLTGAGHEVRAAADGVEALRVAREERPTVVLLDIHLPGMSGYQILHKLRSELGGVPAIFVSGTRTESYDRVGGLLLGADDYIVKPFDNDELVARVERLLERTRGANGDAAATPSANGAATEASRLTAREQDVLRLLAAGQSPKEIGSELFISPKTVSTHIQNILAKLRVHSQAQAVAVAFRDNLVSSDN